MVIGSNGKVASTSLVHECAFSLLRSKGEGIYSLIAHVLCICDVIMNTLHDNLFYCGFPPYQNMLSRHCTDIEESLKQQRHIWGCFLLPFCKVLMFERFVPLTEAKKMYVSNNGQAPSFLLVRYCCTQTISGLALYSSLKTIL